MLLLTLHLITLKVRLKFPGNVKVNTSYRHPHESCTVSLFSLFHCTMHLTLHSFSLKLCSANIDIKMGVHCVTVFDTKFKALLSSVQWRGLECTQCNTGPLPNGCLWRQVRQTSISLVGDVVITATLECWILPLCGSDTVLFGLSKPLHLNRKQGH